jgi:hypothetical protein
LHPNVWPARAAVFANVAGQQRLQVHLGAMNLDKLLHVELGCAPAFVAVHPQSQLVLHQMVQRAVCSAGCCFHNYRYYLNMISTAIST